ncbi:SRPBCC family protein [Mycobacterium sp.]|uniref:SRPBCC family protein n=1 Tax=Mycobacterium sp. TaxID=1785 RepID=UPI003BA85926
MRGVTRSVLVRRPVDEVAKVATDPELVFPIINGFGSFDLISRNPDGSQEWDIYLDVGAVHVGGRVLVEPPSGHAVAWRSQRGTRHSAQIEVASAEGGASVSMSVTVEFAGLLTGWITTFLANGILARRVEAGLQRLRHRIEYGD